MSFVSCNLIEAPIKGSVRLLVDTEFEQIIDVRSFNYSIMDVLTEIYKNRYNDKEKVFNNLFLFIIWFSKKSNISIRSFLRFGCSFEFKEEFKEQLEKYLTLL